MLRREFCRALFAFLACSPLASVRADESQARCQVGGDAKPDDWKSHLLDHLRTNHAGRTWDVGPQPIETPEVRQAYGGRRFFMVLSYQPLFPYSGIPRSPDDPIYVKYREKLAKFREKKISLTVEIDDQGKVAEYREVADFARGLMKIYTEADVKVAVAAILTLFVRDEHGYVPVAADDVNTSTPNYPSLVSVELRPRNLRAQVSFGPHWKLVGIHRGAIDIPG